MSSDAKNKKRTWIDRLNFLLTREPKTKEQLMTLLRSASDHSLMSMEMLGMIESILQVSEMQVREVMVPKSQMVIIEKDSALESILPIVIESGHSRFPVVDANNNVSGMLLAKDLLRFYFQQEPSQFHIMQILRPTVFVPQSKRLDILLREFRVTRNHIAIVLDEYGHVAGLVTIEDVLEQIVGEIEDEYDIDEESNEIKKHSDGSYIVKAAISIEEFNDYFKTRFSDEEFDTLGGILLKHFGHLPKRGEKIKLESLRFKVLNSDNRRIYLLEVRPLKQKQIL